MPINKEKLQAREEARVSRPEFIRPESWRYKRLETNWRKPKGIDNHQRKQKSRGGNWYTETVKTVCTNPVYGEPIRIRGRMRRPD